MPDIMTHILNEEALEKDPEGHLLALGEWNETIALQRAQEQNIELTPQHLVVIRFLREHYRDHGPTDNARVLFHALEERFSGEGGKRYLFSLFPYGPLMQGSKIAGLPTPPNSADPSFGSVH